MQINSKFERLEARITAEQKSQFQYAANILGRSLTDFAVSILQEAAIKIIHEHEVIRLSMEDQKVFLTALVNVPAPNKQLLKAANRHNKIIQK